MTQITLYPAGYLIRIASYENDGDNSKTKEVVVATEKEARWYQEIYNLFQDHRVGNLFELDESEKKEYHEAILKFKEEFIEEYSEMFPEYSDDIDVLSDKILFYAYKIGLSGESEWFSRSPDGISIIYFSEPVIAYKIV